MPGSASLVWVGEVMLCWTGGGFESSWSTPATCQFSRQKFKKQIYLETLQFSLHLAAVVAPPNQNIMGTLDESNTGEAYQRNKTWSGPEDFYQLSSSQKSGKSTEVECSEK